MGVSYFKSGSDDSTTEDSDRAASHRGEEGAVKKSKEIISYLSFVNASEGDGKSDGPGKGEVSRMPLGENAAIVCVRWPAATNQIVAG